MTVERPRSSQERKETENRHCAVITISGRSGTGKTVVAQLLVETIESHTGRRPQFLKVGEDLIRTPFHGENMQDIFGNRQTALEKDVEIDQKQRELIKQATPENLLILESWLGAIIADEEKEKALQEGRRPPKVVSFLLVAPDRIRFKRIFKRQKKSNPDLPHRTTKIRDATIKREKEDLERWEKLHPQLVGIKPFSCTLGRRNAGLNKDNTGKPIYDYIIDTTHWDVNQVAEVMFNLLIGEGHIRAFLTPETL